MEKPRKIRGLSSVIAHRGAPTLAPENTLAAFKKAAELGAEWIEFDVQLSKDLELVVTHDTSTARTTGVKAKVSALTLAQLKGLDAGSWFSDAFAGEQIPTLLEVLQCATEYSLNINIEIKSPAKNADIMAQVLLAELGQAKFFQAKTPEVLVSSSCVANLLAVHRHCPQLPLAFIMDRWSGEWQKVLDQLPLYSIHVNYKALTKDQS